MKIYYPDKVSLKVAGQEVKGFSPDIEIEIEDVWELPLFELKITGFDYVTQSIRTFATGIVNEEKLYEIGKLAREKNELKMTDNNGKLVVHLTSLHVEEINRNKADKRSALGREREEDNGTI
jgi:ABC-type lipopolysaccharide export system ATPase subunit